jgi:hypothetical protein
VSAHTPGPWIAGGMPKDPSGLLITSDDGTKYHRRILVAETLVPAGLDSQHPIVQANARLIAAAPDLLRELRMLVLQCSCGSHPDGEIAGACGRCAAAIDAINKAEGR